MKISFQNQDPAAMGLQTSLNSKAGAYASMMEHNNQNGNGIRLELNKSGEKKTSFGGEYGINGNGLFHEGGFLQHGKSAKQGKTMAEIQQEAGNIDVSVSQDYQTVLAHTLSDEDYAKAQEEGFHLDAMSQADVVTIQDKVKAEMAKSGTVIEGYNDDLSMATLAEALGSAELARTVGKTMAEANLPLTKENVEEIGKAWEIVSTLEEPAEAQVAYLVEQEMEPTIWNLYQAENVAIVSSVEEEVDALRNPAQREDVDSVLLGKENEKLRQQVEDLVDLAGFGEEKHMTKEEGMHIGAWLLKQGLPITKDNLQKVEMLEQFTFPILPEDFAKSAAAAISKGVNPLYADLSEKQDIYHQAVALEQEWKSPQKWEEMAVNLAARRQLEEIRLSMTAEVNVKLLSSDFSIDTAPMEQLIDALKEAEKQVAAQYFPTKYEESPEAAVEDYRTMEQTNQAVADLHTAPAAVLGLYSSRDIAEINLNQLHEEGQRLRDEYVRADESYEALMTAPRADLGDSIRKAFANVRDLVEELSLPVTEENERAVRILGYNRMDVSRENVLKIAEADAQVQQMIRRMTPAAVLHMIREGVNPLEKDFAELDNYLRELEVRRDQTVELSEQKDYAAFLYGLDRQDALTPEERDAFIGIYRMIHQIEKNDGAAIGGVMNAQVELQFKNLLSAARSSKVKGINVKVTDSFGGLTELIREGRTITEQISAGFSGDRRQEEAEHFREAAEVTKEAMQMVQMAQLTDSAENIMAAQQFIDVDANLYGELLKMAMKQNAGRSTRDAADKSSSQVSPLSGLQPEVASEEKVMELLRDGASLLDTEEDFGGQYEAFLREMQTIAEQMTNSSETYVDIQTMQQMGRQILLAQALATPHRNQSGALEQEYIVPMTIGEETVKVHLTIMSGEDKGMTVRTALGPGEDVEAHFYMEEGIVQGFLVGNYPEKLQKMPRVSDILLEQRNNRSKDASSDTSDGADTKKLLQAAKVFLRAVKEAL